MVHNRYGKGGGEDTVAEGICRLLTEHGHEVVQFSRNSADIIGMRYGNVRAFFSGIYSPSVAREFKACLAQEKPDIVHIQNVYPLISPSVFAISRQASIPVVFRCANYRMFCPNGLLYSRGEICERCVGGREYWCVLRNCMKPMPKSIGYAVRNAYARVSGLITKNTTMYYMPSEFQKQKFVAWGIPSDRIAVIPNFITAPERPGGTGKLGEYVAYAGGISPYKGFPSLLLAAQKCHDIPFRVAGCLRPPPKVGYDIPSNMMFLGRLARDDMATFYANARMVIMPSTCYETFGMVIVEAMIEGRPVVASRISGIPGIVDEDSTGLLYEPGNSDELAGKIRRLWNDAHLCRTMGQAGREKALREYSPERYYQRLMAVYQKAMRQELTCRQ